MVRDSCHSSRKERVVTFSSEFDRSSSSEDKISANNGSQSGRDQVQGAGSDQQKGERVNNLMGRGLLN